MGAKENLRNFISANSIYGNKGLGIKLGDPGATPLPNDSQDSDTGANTLQNYPILTSATLTNGNVNIKGGLLSTPSTIFFILFYADAAPDPSGYGEGRFYLGRQTVTSDEKGYVFFDVTFPYVAETAVVTATATDFASNTSEFSKAIAINGVPSHLLNVSTRLRVGTGENVLIAGFIVTGQDRKPLIVRALGPSLTAFGVPNALQDPTLELFASGAQFAFNDNWKDTDPAAIQATGIAPTDGRESAITGALIPQSYTAILRGKGDTTGIGLVDVYDLDQSTLSKLGNVSTRGFVDTGDNVLIGGVIIGGPSGGTMRAIFRGMGPSLTAAGIGNALQDPTLELRDGSGTLIASNDNWKDDDAANISATGIPPQDDRESAIVRTLPPGNYTAQVRGKNDTVGVGLVEAYSLP
ncbi:MAG: hypothetical protein M3Z64_04375 [Verrucomicrobiota bacterium]|nr:hypothetical protein [Verrucomicrobiota bacterium]